MYYLEKPDTKRLTYKYANEQVLVYVEDGFYLLPQQGTLPETIGELEIIDILTKNGIDPNKQEQTDLLFQYPESIPIFALFSLKKWLVAKWEYIRETYLQDHEEIEMQKAWNSFIDGNINNAETRLAEIKVALGSETTVFTPNLDKAKEAHEKFIIYLKTRPPFPEKFVKPGNAQSDLSKFSAAQQVIAIKFLFEYAKIKVHNDKAIERFLHFLTGKSSDNLYKLWRSPYKDIFAQKKKDLREVKKYFEDLEANEIVKMIDNEINNP